jgi:hypothetical protein
LTAGATVTVNLTKTTAIHQLNAPLLLPGRSTLNFSPSSRFFWKFLARQTAQRRTAQQATASSTPQPITESSPSAVIIE